MNQNGDDDDDETKHKTTKQNIKQRAFVLTDFNVFATTLITGTVTLATIQVLTDTFYYY